MSALRMSHSALMLSIAAVAAAGCGGSSNHTPKGVQGASETPKAAPATTPLSPVTPSTGTTSAAASTGSPFCIQLSHALGNLVTKNDIPAIEAARDKLKALTPPAGAQSQYESFIADLTNWIALLKIHSGQAQHAGELTISDEHAAARAAGCS